MRKDVRENIVNTAMIVIVFVVAAGSGLLIEKNLHDKEAREAKAALDKQNVQYADFMVLQPLSDPVKMQTEGFIMSNGKMYQTDGTGVKPMATDVILPNKTKVLTTGKMIFTSGSSRVLGNNEMIDWNGDVVKNTHSLELTTPISTPSVTIAVSPSPKTK